MRGLGAAWWVQVCCEIRDPGGPVSTPSRPTVRHFAYRRWRLLARGGAYTFGGGKGSRTGSGLSFTSIPFKV